MKKMMIVAGIASSLTGCAAIFPPYAIWEQEMYGKAELAKAQSTRQIAVTEANAKRESAQLLADAEVIRAKGVAEANKIIGDSLKNNSEYLRYLWIDGMNHDTNQIIYVPTEAGLPILEANRLRGNNNEN